MIISSEEMNGRENNSHGMVPPVGKVNMASIDDPISTPRPPTGGPPLGGGNPFAPPPPPMPPQRPPKRGGIVDCCGDECPIMCLCPGAFFEYETPKVVTVKNVPLGILRLFLQVIVIVFVVFYQLWYARGYQEFAEVEASVTTKVKGFSR